MTVQTRQMTRTIAKGQSTQIHPIQKYNGQEPLVPIPPYNLGDTVKNYVLRYTHLLIDRMNQEPVVENKMRINLQMYQIIGTYFPQVPCHDAWLILAITIYHKTNEFLENMTDWMADGMDKELINLYSQELSKVQEMIAKYIKSNAPGKGKYLIPNL